MSGSHDRAFEERYQCGTSIGSILWDVSAIKLAVKQGIYPVREFDTQTLLKENPSPVKKEFAMTTDLTEPGIIVQLSEDFWKLIDGNHRLYKASVLGVETFRCYVLSTEDQLKYILDLDRGKYAAIVDSMRLEWGIGA